MKVVKQNKNAAEQGTSSRQMGFPNHAYVFLLYQLIFLKRERGGERKGFYILSHNIMICLKKHFKYIMFQGKMNII